MPSNVKLLAGASGGEPTDANFKNVTLLLHGDGSNGAQNNTFIDSSSNNFTITRNGNTTQGSFSPYGSNWSNYFDGSGDYLSTPSSSALAVGTGDFTLECWIYTTSTPSDIGIYEGRSTGSATDGFTLTAFSSSVIRIYAGGVVVASSGTTYVNTWVHVAVTRSSGTTTLWINGVSQGTSTASYNCTNTDAIIGGGRYSAGSSVNTYFPGYISNFRIIKGTALYTSNFTPSTTPLTAITNTSLLTCAYNRFRDGSTNNFTITRNGDVKVTNFAPFAPSSAYSTAANGGSAYFDGSGDYLAMPSNAAFGLGSGDFTVECWVNPSVQGGHGSSNNDCIIDFRPGSNGAYGTLYIVNNGSGVNWYANTAVQITGGPIPNNAWTHLAVSRVSGSTRLFINGVQSGGTYSDGTTYATTNPWIGQFNDGVGSGWFQGYISNFRILKGTGLYSGSFTPPTAPLTAVTNTQFLLNATNAAIFDNSMKNDLETVGNAQISTSVKKFGTGSIYFDGSGDNLFSPSTPDMDFGSGNWTIEMWVYVSTRTTNYPLIFGNNRGSWTTDALALTASNADSSPNWTDRFVFGWNNGGFSSVSYGTSQLLVANVTNSTGTWYHFAVVRNGTSVKMYRNGTEVASATVSSTATFNWGYNGTLMGGGNWDGAAGNFNGYLDEVRATKGVARYTSAFTAPTAPFPNK